MKKNFLLLVLMLLMGAQINVKADDGGFYYIIESSGANLVFCDIEEGDVVIPSELIHNGKIYPVTTISGAFQDHYSLTSITIPSSVTTIQADAFKGCYFSAPNFINNSTLTSSDNWGAIFFDEETSDGLIIKDNVVVSCRDWATSVTIPENITSIGNKAFHSHKNLTSITIPNSVKTIGNYAFSGCTNLTSVNIPDSITKIEYGTFQNCSSLTNVTIPEGVTYIDENTFDGCENLAKIIIPSSVTIINYNAFRGCCNLKECYCKAETIPYAVGRWDSPSIFDTKVESATLYVPVGCINLYKNNPKWNLFGSYKHIPLEMAQSMPVSSIQNSGCLGETDGSSVSTITLLKEGNILTVNLLNYTSPCGTQDFGITSMVGNCVGDNPCSVYIDVKPIYEEEADCICPYNVSFTIHNLESNKFILSCWWFEGEVTLTDGEMLKLDDAPEEISIDNIKYTIDKKNLTAQLTYGKECEGDVIIPSELEYKGFKYTVTSIGDYAFRGGGGITSVIIPESVTSIGVYAFNKCGGLTSINIPDGVKVLKETFEDCGQLTSVTVGRGILKIDNAFNNCAGIKSFYCYAEIVPELIVHGRANFGESHNMTLYVPAQSVDLYKKAFQWPKRFEYIKALPQPINFTENQMATIILPTEPDTELGRYYKLDRRQENLIVFEEEHAPKADTPYIIIPKKDFIVDLSTLDLNNSHSNVVSVQGISFIGSYTREELYCPDGCYIDIIDRTPDCIEAPSYKNKNIIGALHAYLRVSWEDPLNPGGTRSGGEPKKLSIVLHNNPNGTTGIGGIQNSKIKTQDDAIYDLSGRRITWQGARSKGQENSNQLVNSSTRQLVNSLKKGIYIIDGKQVLVK